MKLMTITDINDLDRGDEVSGLKATIKEGYMPSKGSTPGKGKWKVQAAMLEDESGTIRASFWNLFDDDLRDYEGKEVTVSSGVFAEDWKNPKSGKTQRQLKVSEEANVEFGDEPQNSREEVTGESEPKAKHSSRDESRASFERQAALSASIQFCSSIENNTADAVITIAGRFYKFLSNGEG